MKRSHLNYALLTVTLGLAAAVFFSQKKEEKGAPLTPLGADAVHSIVLDHPGSAAIRLEKGAGGWQLTAPVKADADPMEVAGIVNLAVLESKSTLEPTQVNLADLQLNPPAYKVMLNDQVLEFGGSEPLQFRRYIKNGAKISLVDDPAAEVLDANYSELVAKNLLPIGAEIVKVQLPKLSVAYAADGKSLALTPDDPKAGADRRQQFVDAWKNARAMWNAEETGEQAKADEKADAVIVTLKDRELKFLVAERDPQLVLVRPDLKVRYTLSKELVGQMLQIPDEKKKPEPAETAKPAEGVQSQ